MSDETDDRWTRAVAEGLTAPHWRCLSELLDAPDFRARIAGEFPAGADTWDAATTRRGFLQLLSATLALGGAQACTRAPSERIVPYGVQPPEVTPGVPSYYATAMTLGGYATGLVIESHEGRPTKVEGNAEHPASLGAAGVLEQASVLGLYDPSRARAIHQRGAPASWRAFVEAVTAGPATSGRGLHFLLEPTSSPLLGDLLARVRAQRPAAQFYFYAPLARDAAWAGARLAFGRVLEAQYNLRAASVVVALDADLLASGPMHLRHARHFAERRRVRGPTDAMNRLYAVEASWSVTGGAADHRLRARRGDVRAIATALLGAVLAATPGAHATAGRAAALPAHQQRWVDAVAGDLRANLGAGLVVAGDGQPPEVHAAAHALNAALGNVGHTVVYTAPPILDAGGASHGLDALVQALSGGQVDTLVILEGNPSYTAPADLAFARVVRAARRSVYLGLYENETAGACEWFVPAAHYLEAWGDARAADGTVTLQQPLIAPLYAGRTAAELLAVFLGDADPSAHRLLREFWRRERGVADTDEAWDAALQRGVLADTAAPAVDAPLAWDAVTAALGAPEAPGPAGLELAFVADARVYDGAFANNAWLLELPDPLTKLTWDNAALFSPATAARLALASEDVVEIRYRGRSLRAPVLVQPGHADDAISLALGYGRTGAEALARGCGANAYALRTSAAPAFGGGAAVTKLPGQWELAVTQTHWTMEGRAPVQETTLAAYRRDPQRAAAANRRPEALYALRPTAPHQWAMSIDLAACTGCSACVVACQAENNTPIVGKVGVRKSREMHWLRIDRYFTGGVEDPGIAVQPMLCQHCESAPCEYVCPVNATVHSPDGLNEQVYNRCVGTRFCSNNCPYKVRRFNYLNYHRDVPETVQMVMNPDVTVRARGVMEKCTYCVQRIREGEIAARVAGRALRDGEIQTACQQTCPTQAIAFGSLGDPASEVTALRRNDRTYAVLNELGTVPRTRYLTRLRNPNPALEPEPA